MVNMMITLIWMELIGQDDEYDKNKLLFQVICDVLLFLSLINLNMYIINTCEFDLFNQLVKYYYISDIKLVIS